MGAIYLIRHGQASFGKTDYDQLSELGVRQSRHLGETLSTRLARVDAAFSGTLRRHRQTAENCLAAAAPTLSAVSLQGFDEFDHSEVLERYQPRYSSRMALVADVAMTLKPRRRFQEIFSAAVARWVSGLHDDEYTVTWPRFRERCVTALSEIIGELGRSRTALIFTSAGPITAVCQEILGMPDEHAFRLNWTLTNCGITKLIYSDRGRYLSTLNDHSHFEGRASKLLSYR